MSEAVYHLTDYKIKYDQFGLNFFFHFGAINSSDISSYVLNSKIEMLISLSSMAMFT